MIYKILLIRIYLIKAIILCTFKCVCKRRGTAAISHLDGAGLVRDKIGHAHNRLGGR